MCPNGSFDSQFEHLIKSTILARSKSARVEQTRYKCIFFVLNVKNTRNAFYETRTVRNSCSKGNIDRSKSERKSGKLITCSRSVRNPCEKGIIDRNKNALVEQTRCKCIFFVL